MYIGCCTNTVYFGSACVSPIVLLTYVVLFMIFALFSLILYCWVDLWVFSIFRTGLIVWTIWIIARKSYWTIRVLHRDGHDCNKAMPWHLMHSTHFLSVVDFFCKISASRSLANQLCDCLFKFQTSKSGGKRSLKDAVEHIAASMTWGTSRVPVLPHNKLTICQRLGSGQGGIVYAGLLHEREKEDREVAIKQCSPGMMRNQSFAEFVALSISHSCENFSLKLQFCSIIFLKFVIERRCFD